MDIDEEEQLLSKAGWELECRSPFEIRHTETGSFASGIAAKLVVDCLQAADKGAAPAEGLFACQETIVSRVAEFDKVVDVITSVFDSAQSLRNDQAWKDSYSLIFSDFGSGKVSSVLKALNLELSYCDPDSSYEEDVTAYVQAVKTLHARTRPLLQALTRME